MSHERRDVRFDDWDAVIADAQHLRDVGYKHASYGKLTLGQICAHLAIVMNFGVDGFPKLFPWPMRTLARALVLKKMLRHERLNFRAKAPAAIAPPRQIDDGDGVDALIAAIEHFRNHSGEYQLHPVFGKLTRDQWRHQQFWHCEHHLSFLIPKA